MRRTEQKLIYILGFPHSGSTIFSVALGSSPRIFNAGEISFIENDYHNLKRCSCGSSLAKCKFWAPLSREIDSENGSTLNLSETGQLRDIDSRNISLVKKAMLLAGFPLEKVFSSGEVIDYAQRHEDFLQRIGKFSDASYIVDASKSERRLTSLLRHTNIDIKVILLKRSARDIYAAKIKRARRRKKLYSSLLSPVYFAWLVYGMIRIDNCLKEIPKENVTIVDFDNFVKSPQNTLENFGASLNEKIKWDLKDRTVKNMNDQHVFTGSAWLHKASDHKYLLTISPPRIDSLSFTEKHVFKIGKHVFSKVRYWDGLV